MKNRTIDYGKILMWCAVLVSMPRWAGAFISADTAVIPPFINELLHILNLLSGLGMGVLEVLASAYILDAWGKLKPKRTYNAKRLDHRWVVLTGFVVGLFVMMPVILAPYVVARMTAVSVSDVLGAGAFRAIWAVAVVLSPAFIVGGVAIANGNLINEKETSQATKMKPVKQPKRKPDKQPLQPELQEIGNLTGTRKTVFRLWQRNPNATQQQLADELHNEHGITISRQAVGKHLKALNGKVENG